jgi:hypothetical protein
MRPYLSKAVMDIVPLPNGQGFLGGNLWWEYVRSQDESAKLEVLITLATLSEEVWISLLAHNIALLKAFAFSEETIAMLSEINADTVEGFAQAILLRRNRTI